MKPIFFAWTRSFWLSVIGLAMLIFGAPPEVLHGIGAVLSTVTPWTAEQVGSALTVTAPAILWVIALQQRSGAARPYTRDFRAL